MGPLESKRSDEEVAALLAEASWVRGLARRLARDHAAAEDVTQGALALALEKRPRLGDGLRPWLARVVGRLVRHGERERVRRHRREAAASGQRSAAAPPADELFERLEAQEHLSRLVRSLPQPYAEVLLRRFYEGQSVEEIARAMGASPATTRSRLARAIERLRQDYGAGRRRSPMLLAMACGARPISNVPSLAAITLMQTSTKVASLAVVAILGVAAFMTVSTTGGEGPSMADAASGESQPDLVPVGARDSSSSLAGVAPSAERQVTPSAEAIKAPKLPEAAPQEPQTSIIRIKVVDESSAPIEGATMRSIFADGRPRGEGNEARSGAAGEIVLELEDDALRKWRAEVFQMIFSVSAEGRATELVMATPELHGEIDAGVVELGPGGTLTGIVLGTNGTPIPGATLYRAPEIVPGDVADMRLKGPDRSVPRPRTDGDVGGRFQFTGLEPGPCRLWVHARGYQWQLTEPVEVTAGLTVDIGSIELEAISSDIVISGVVVTPDGEPASGARVSFESSSREGKEVTGADGTFQIFPTTKSAHLIIARCEGFGMSRAVRGSPGEEIELRLTAEASVAVTVVDENGDAVEAADLMVSLHEVQGLGVFRTSSTSAPGFKWAHTDAEGRVDIPAAGQPFLISVSKRGYSHERAGPFEAPNVPTEITVTLVRDPSIRGRVTHRGQPVEGAEVFVAMRMDDFRPIEHGFTTRFFRNRGHEVKTGPDGTFDCTIEGDRPTITVVATADGLATAEVELDLEPGKGVDDLALEMTLGGSIHGRLEAPPGERPDQYIVAASRGDGEPEWVRPADDGTYTLENLTPGWWRVEGRDREPTNEYLSVANTPEEKDFGWNVYVNEGESTQFDVDHRAQGLVAVTGVVTVDGQPAEGWTIVANEASLADRKTDPPATLTGEGGRFSLDVFGGKYELECSGDLPGSASAVVRRTVAVEGEQLDISVSITTAEVDELIDGDVEVVRFVRGATSSDAQERTRVPVKDGRVRARVPVGSSSLQVPDKNFPGRDFWSAVRMVEVK